MNKKIVIISAQGEKSFLPDQVRKIKSVSNATFIPHTHSLSAKELIFLTHDAEIVAITRRSIKHLPASILQQMRQLKGLVVYSTGYEWIDHPYTHQQNIQVSYLKNYSTTTVAEHTIGLFLAMSRRIHLSFDKVREIIPNSISIRGWELKNKKLGIIGFGRIGQKVAQLASVFGMEIYYYDIGKKQVNGVSYLPLDQLLASCDMISLHASRKYQEPPILDAHHISMIRKGACIINVSRPELIDTSALISAINTGNIVGYAVDEKLDRRFTTRLSDYGRVLETGHSAWYSSEAIARGIEEWTDNIYYMAIDQPQNLLQWENHDAKYPTA